MKFELSIENSEIYRNLPKYPYHKRYRRIKNDLMQLHPGFSDDSIWDYQTGKKGITACVINRDFFEEKRIFHPLCRFISKEEGKSHKRKIEMEFFKWACYTKEGKRRKNGRIYLWLAVFLVLLPALLFGVLSGCGLVMAGTEKADNNPAPVLEKESSDRYSQSLLLPLINAGMIINKNGGKISGFEVYRQNQSVIQIGVRGGNAGKTVAELAEQEIILASEISEISWIDNEPVYNISLLTVENSENLEPDISKLLYAFSETGDILQNTGNTLVSSVLHNEEGVVSFNFIASNTKPFLNGNIEQVLAQNKIVLRKMSIVPPDNPSEPFLIECDVVPVTDSILITEHEDFPFEELVWDFKEPDELMGKEEQENIPDKDLTPAESLNSEDIEIGRMKNGKEIIVFFRKTDGKLYTKKYGEKN